MPVCVTSAQSTVTNSPPRASASPCALTCSASLAGATYTTISVHTSATSFHTAASSPPAASSISAFPSLAPLRTTVVSSAAASSSSWPPAIAIIFPYRVASVEK
ncbi:hypothetical protein DAI22_06g011001 [Oryza sativa Japonica Group]|nr:hypothetical protein DAI22_06g011001 [Oryza sativa Japonica Group]